MNQNIKFIFLALLFATLIVVGVLIGSTIYRRYTGLTRGKSALLWLFAVAILPIGIMIFLRITHTNLHANLFNLSSSDEEPIWKILTTILLWLFLLPFCVKLYRKWIGGQLTDAEKLPGSAGVRAWLGVGNVICAGLIPICVWQVFGFSPVGFWALTFGALLAYPLVNMASESAQPAPVSPTEDLSSEREKVLQLLEAGKISAVESAELLNALGHSAPPPPKPAAEINPQRKLVLIGAALLLIGFFLPWFSVKGGDLMYEMPVQFQLMVNDQAPTVTPMKWLVHAGDVKHGLGWWILALGIVAAVLPFFATTLEAVMQKKIILAALGVGAILLIYLLSDAFRYVSFGILLALAGYALELVGTLKERPLAR